METAIVIALALLLLPLIVWFQTWLLMVCWNAFVPDIFHLATLDMTHAFCAVLILGIIGGAFRSVSSSK